MVGIENRLPPLNICLQVNTRAEINKTGIALDRVEALAEYCLSLPRLKLRGLMTIPAVRNSFDEQRQKYQYPLESVLPLPRWPL